MTKINKLFIIILAFAVFLVLAVWGYNALKNQYKPDNSISSTDKDTANEVAPDFSVQDIDGKTVKLSSFTGKPIVLNFWASWCPPCRNEMPHYNKLYLEYSNKGVIFLMVDLTDGQRETISMAKKFITDNNYEFPVYFDINGDAANAYAISSIPVSIFINKSGNIVKSYTGSLDEKTIENAIKGIIE